MKLFLYAVLLINGLACANYIQADNITRLMYAAAAGNVKVVTELLKAGVDINAKKDGLTALMCAVQEPNRLPFKGAVVGKQEDKTVLAQNDAPDKLAVMRILLEPGFSINVEDAQGYTALLYAIREYYLNYITFKGDSQKLEPFIQRIEFLLDNGAQYKESPALKRELTKLNYFKYEMLGDKKNYWFPYTGIELCAVHNWKNVDFEKDVFWLYPIVLHPVKSRPRAAAEAAYKEYQARQARVDAINQRLVALLKYPKMKPQAVQAIQQAVKPSPALGSFPGQLAGLVADYLTFDDLAIIQQSASEELAPGRGDAKRRAADESPEVQEM